MYTTFQKTTHHTFNNLYTTHPTICTQHPSNLYTTPRQNVHHSPTICKPHPTICKPHLKSMYTTLQQSVHHILRVCTQHPNNLYATSQQSVHKTSTIFTQHSDNLYTTPEQSVHNTPTVCTQHSDNLYTTSRQTESSQTINGNLNIKEKEKIKQVIILKNTATCNIKYFKVKTQKPLKK